MPYCPKCGVELDYGIEKCPLCTFPIPDTGGTPSTEVSRDSILLDRYHLKKEERRNRLLEARPVIYVSVLLTLTLLSIVFGFVDYYYYDGLTWSRYVIAVNFAAAACLFFLMGIIRAFPVNVIGVSLTVVGFLYLIDSFDDRVSWFWNLGMIISSNIMIWTLVLRALIIHSRRRGLNIPAYGLFSMAVACASIDIVQNITVHQSFRITWAVPVLSALIPAGILFLLLHILLSPSVKEKIKRLFHI